MAVFNLEDIYAVVFRCRECRTEVNLLRIRWSHSPECCPNCGVPWMRDSSAEPVHPDDISGRAFESIEALRLALQSLACLATHMDFKIGLVTDRGVNHPYIVVSDHQEGNDKSRE